MSILMHSPLTLWVMLVLVLLFAEAASMQRIPFPIWMVGLLSSAMLLAASRTHLSPLRAYSTTGRRS